MWTGHYAENGNQELRTKNSTRNIQGDPIKPHINKISDKMFMNSNIFTSISTGLDTSNQNCEIFKLIHKNKNVRRAATVHV